MSNLSSLPALEFVVKLALWQLPVFSKCSARIWLEYSNSYCLISLQWCQAIIWTNAGILLIGPLGINFSEILIEIITFSFMKMRLKVSSAKRRPFCFGLSVLNCNKGQIVQLDGPEMHGVHDIQTMHSFLVVFFLSKQVYSNIMMCRQPSLYHFLLIIPCDTCSHMVKFHFNMIYCLQITQQLFLKSMSINCHCLVEYRVRYDCIMMILDCSILRLIIHCYHQHFSCK